jgi:hypothetical protein
MDENLEQEKTALEMEREELNLLISKGIKFSVSFTALRMFRKPAAKTRTYEIKQPTLATLDRISALSVDMVIDKSDLQNSEEAISKAWLLVSENCRKLAQVVALAALGEDYCVRRFSLAKLRFIWVYRNKALSRLTDLFFHTIKPSQLAHLTAAITNISNLADFTYSMRLLSGARSTQPKTGRIE